MYEEHRLACIEEQVMELGLCHKAKFIIHYFGRPKGDVERPIDLLVNVVHIDPW